MGRFPQGLRATAQSGGALSLLCGPTIPGSSPAALSGRYDWRLAALEPRRGGRKKRISLPLFSDGGADQPGSRFISFSSTSPRSPNAAQKARRLKLPRMPRMSTLR